MLKSVKQLILQKRINIFMAKKNTKKNTDKKFNINKLLIISVLVVSVVVLLYQRATSTTGSVAIVDFSKSDVVYEISLDKDDTYTFSEGTYPIFLEVKDGAIRFYDMRVYKRYHKQNQTKQDYSFSRWIVNIYFGTSCKMRRY